MIKNYAAKYTQIDFSWPIQVWVSSYEITLDRLVVVLPDRLLLQLINGPLLTGHVQLELNLTMISAPHLLISMLIPLASIFKIWKASQHSLKLKLCLCNKDHWSVGFNTWVEISNCWIRSWRKAYHLEWCWAVIRPEPFYPMSKYLGEFQVFIHTIDATARDDHKWPHTRQTDQKFDRRDLESVEA